MRVSKVEDYHSFEELDDLIKKYRTDAEVQNRLLYIRGVKSGLKSNVIAEVLNKTPQICSKWLKDYNEHGIEGITSNRSKSGVKSKLTEKDLEKIKKNTNTNRPILYNGRCKRHNLLIIQCKI